MYLEIFIAWTNSFIVFFVSKIFKKIADDNFDNVILYTVIYNF